MVGRPAGWCLLLGRGRVRRLSVFADDIPVVLLRRWYLVLLGVLATVGLVVLALRVVPPTYSLTSDVLLLPPESAVAKGENPYLNLGGLESMADVVSKTVTDDRTRREVRAATGDVEYGVALDTSAAAPIVVVGVEARDPEAARATMGFLSQRLEQALQDVQLDSDVPTDALITLMPITQMNIPQVEYKSQVRAGVVAAVGGLAATLLLTALIDAAIRARSRRRTADPATARPPVAATDQPLGTPSAHEGQPDGFTEVTAEDTNDTEPRSTPRVQHAAEPTEGGARLVGSAPREDAGRNVAR
jgi:hypothetical protein